MNCNRIMRMHRFGAILILSSVAISVIKCAPNQASPMSAQISSPSSPSSSSASAAANNQVSTTSAPKPISSGSSSVTGNAIGSMFGLNLRSAAVPSPVGQAANSNGPAADELETFEGKNLFSDDSLWRIPINLVRDLNEGGSDSKASKSTSASAVTTNLHNDDEDEADADYDDRAPVSSLEAKVPQSASSSSPTVISATSDLKAAAGYHYPSHGHHGYGHDYGHHGGGHHYGASDHYGKYFQYASVPYPYAWDFGYRRGNPYHTIERYEYGKGPHFHTKVKWNDKYGGYGVHVWDYNHDDHHSDHYGGGHHHYAPSHYGHHGGHYGHH